VNRITMTACCAAVGASMWWTAAPTAQADPALVDCQPALLQGPGAFAACVNQKCAAAAYQAPECGPTQQPPPPPPPAGGCGPLGQAGAKLTGIPC
jgi:hypothetical protein